MNKEEFKKKIMDEYFGSKKHKDGTNPKGIFCALCAYKRYVREKGKIRQTVWAKMFNVPAFGYNTKDVLGGGQMFYKEVAMICKTEDFIYLAPDWKEYVDEPEKKEPELFNETTLADIFAQMNYVIARLDKMIEMMTGWGK